MIYMVKYGGRVKLFIHAKWLLPSFVVILWKSYLILNKGTGISYGDTSEPEFNVL